MPEEAVLDAVDIGATDTSDSTPVESPSTPVESDLGGEPQGAEGQEQGQTSEEERVTSQKPVFADNKLDQKVKQHLDKIRAEDPVTAARMRNALIQGEALRAEIPGGVKEARQMRQTIEGLGGEEGIRDLRNYEQEFDQLREAYNKADPSFIDELIKSNESSFAKYAPQIFDKFREIDNDGWTAYLSQVVLADMQAQGIGLALQRLEDFLPADNPKAAQQLAAINAYMQRLAGYAQKPVVTPKAAQAPDQREAEFRQRETSLIATQYQNTERGVIKDMVSAELAKLAGNRQISAKDRAEIMELFATKFRLKLKSLPNFNQMRSRYFDSRDEKGHLKYIQSSFANPKILPAALQEAFERVVGKPGATAAKPGTPAAPNGARPAPKPAVSKDGYNWVSKMPDQTEFDTARMNTDMVRQGRAVLKNGKKVYWK